METSSRSSRYWSPAENRAGDVSAHTLRREADMVRLRELAVRSGGRLELLEVSARSGRPFRLGIHCRTAASSDYPRMPQNGVTLRIDLPARYPFERPVLTVETRIFHPNIFASGVICQGDKWLPGEGLDLLVRRIIRLVTFDPAHVNPASAANRAAAAWYLQQRSKSPEAFPTDRIDFGPAAMATAPASATSSPADSATPPGERVVRHCPACDKGLRLPAGKHGSVVCPACRREFEITT